MYVCECVCPCVCVSVSVSVSMYVGVRGCLSDGGLVMWWCCVCVWDGGGGVIIRLARPTTPGMDGQSPAWTDRSDGMLRAGLS